MERVVVTVSKSKARWCWWKWRDHVEKYVEPWTGINGPPPAACRLLISWSVSRRVNALMLCCAWKIYRASTAVYQHQWAGVHGHGLCNKFDLTAPKASPAPVQADSADQVTVLTCLYLLIPLGRVSVHSAVGYILACFHLAIPVTFNVAIATRQCGTLYDLRTLLS